MDSLANYGSDDDCDESPDEQTDWHQGKRDNSRNKRKPNMETHQASDVNYEEVQMDLSEESNDGNAVPDGSHGRDTRERVDGNGSRDDKRWRTNSNDREERRSRERDNRSRSRERRTFKDEERIRDRRDERYSKGGSRKYRRSSSRDRARRSNSRENKRSTGSRNNRRYSRSPRRDRSRRSRSRSRGKTSSSTRNYNHKTAATLTSTTTINESDSVVNEKQQFFMPGITGRFREQIEKRKLLWQKKESTEKKPINQTENVASSAAPTRVTKLWEATTFAQDQDGKVASKFKRLMGIKNQTETNSGAPIDIIKKQEEMFSSMEQQYEVARTATHTMRGVGLGFTSNYQR